MHLRDFRIGWRLLAKEPGQTTVNILGLGAGFAACFLLLAHVQFLFNYDGALPERGRTYAVKEGLNVFSPPVWTLELPLPLSEVAMRNPALADASTVKRREVKAQVGAATEALSLHLVGPAFPSMFGVRVLAGDLDAALARPDTVALTQDYAFKLFGGASALGKTLRIDGRAFTVMALVAAPPANSTVSFTALAGAGSATWPAEERERIADNWGAGAVHLYLRLKPGVPPAAAQAMLQGALDHKMNVAQAGMGKDRFADIALVALPERIFDPHIGTEKKESVLELAALAFAVLLLATINYVNLATVRTLSRQREIGTRKILGAGNGALARQFIVESSMLTVLASGVGLVFAWLALPIFNALMNASLDKVFTPASVLCALAFGAVTGTLAGAYPASLAMRAPSALALTGHGLFESARGQWLRRALTVLQFATSMALGAICLAIAWQAHYAAALDPGFDPRPLLVMEVPGDLRSAPVATFRARLAHLPGVLGTTLAWKEVGLDYKMSAATHTLKDGSAVKYRNEFVNSDFFDVYRVTPLAGRVFDARADTYPPKPDEGGAIVVNAVAAHLLGYANPQDAIGAPLGDAAQIVGVIPNFRHGSAREAAQAVVYRLSPETTILTVRFDGDAGAARAAIAKLWDESFPNDVLEMRGASEILADNYRGDTRMAKLFGAASVVAALLAAFGIYVLAAYNARRRGREIALRKLFGASRADIARLMGKEFALSVALGALCGLPLAYLATERYLAGFVERAPLGPWPLLAALAGASVVALASTARHTMSAMRTAPGLALRA
ncbi:MAG: FtsX-like permease family protein [Pseudomonadota bacterium]